MKRYYCQKKFGKTTVFIEKNGSICIVGDWYSNWGLIYPRAIQSFKNGVINPCTGFHFQVIGMDTQPAKSHVNWIYDKIKKGHFDHLIED